MNMGIQPQLPQPNGFGVFGNDQMLRQNFRPSIRDLSDQYELMREEEYRQAKSEGRALPPDVGNRKQYWIQEQLRGIQPGSKSEMGKARIANTGPAPWKIPPRAPLETGPGVTATGGIPDMEWGLREERKRQTDKILNMSEQDFNKWLGSQSTGPGSWGAAMIQARRRQQSGIPPGAVQVPPSWSEKGWTKGGWKLPDGTMWDPSMGPAPEPRKYPWSSGEPAPERDWEAIRDFHRTLGMRGGKFKELNVNKALKYPDMLNQSFGNSLTLTNLSPKMRADLESQGFKFKTWDETKFPGMNKLGDGKLGIVEFDSAVDAFKAIEKLKAAGVGFEVQPVAEGPLARGYDRVMSDAQQKFPEPTPKKQELKKETKVSKETNKVLTKALFG